MKQNITKKGFKLKKLGQRVDLVIKQNAQSGNISKVVQSYLSMPSLFIMV